MTVYARQAKHKSVWMRRGGGNVGELNCIRGEVYGVECGGQYGRLYPTTVRQRRLVGIRCQPWKTRPRCRVRGTGGWLFPHNLMALAFFNVASAFPELKASCCYFVIPSFVAYGNDRYHSQPIGLSWQIYKSAFASVIVDWYISFSLPGMSLTPALDPGIITAYRYHVGWALGEGKGYNLLWL